MAKGDIIFLSDQDDVWYDNKVSEMTKIIKDTKGLYVLSSDYVILSENCKRKYSKAKVVKKRDLSLSIKSRTSKGCTMAVSKNILNSEIVSLSEGYVGHDWYLDIIASLSNSNYETDFQSIKYRLHSSNASISNSNELFKSNSTVRIGRIKEETNVLEFLITYKDLDRKHKQEIEKQIVFNKKRLKVLENKDIFTWLSLACYLNRYSYIYESRLRGLRIYIGDILYCFK